MGFAKYHEDIVSRYISDNYKGSSKKAPVVEFRLRNVCNKT